MDILSLTEVGSPQGAGERPFTKDDIKTLENCFKEIIESKYEIKIEQVRLKSYHLSISININDKSKGVHQDVITFDEVLAQKQSPEILGIGTGDGSEGTHFWAKYIPPQFRKTKYKDIRFVDPKDRKRLREIDAEIAKLQQEREALRKKIDGA